MDVECIWSICPVEILIITFKLLDSKTLNNVMYTCKRWRDIALSVVSTENLWQVLIEDSMLDSGKSYKKKSKLNWCGIYLNSIQWYEVKTAEINLENYSDIMARSFSIYKGMLVSIPIDIGSKHFIAKCNVKDNLILVTREKVIYYDIETFKCVKEIPCMCQKYEENDNIVVMTSVDTDVVTMKGKPLEIGCESIQNTITKHQNVMFYRLEDNKVYIMGKNNYVIHIYCWTESKWDNTYYTRYYGSTYIIDSLVHNEEMYILIEGGRTYRTNVMIFAFENYKSSNYSLPSSMIVKGFGLLNEDTQVIIGDTSRTNAHCSYDEKSQTMYMECPGLTCFTQHENILFLGYNSGKVEIGIPVNMMKNNGKSEVCFYVNSRKPILGIDVYEELNAHHLFVLTETDLSQFKIPCIHYSEYCY